MGKRNNTELMLYNEIRSAMPLISNINKSRIVPGRNVPEAVLQDIKYPGVFLGLERDNGKGYYVGKGSDVDGNILTIGINGSGKSRFLVKPTLETWQFPIVWRVVAWQPAAVAKTAGSWPNVRGKTVNVLGSV